MTNEWRDAKNAVRRAPYSAVIRLLGGDNLAVRAAKYLSDAGINTVPQLRKAYNRPGVEQGSSLLALGGIGPGMVARIGQALADAERRPVDHFNPDGDLPDMLAFERLADRATAAYCLAIGERPGEDVRQAIIHALRAVEPGITAAALQRAARDTGLPLTRDQRQFLSAQAAEIDPEIIADMTGTNEGG